MSQCPTVAKRIQLRHDTAARWTSANPLLLAGEFAYESDTGLLKVGDGTTRWNSLSYFQSGSGPTGGSSGVIYFFNRSVDADIAGYYQCSTSAITTSTTTLTAHTNGVFASFITNVGQPGSIVLPNGVWIFQADFSMNANGGSPTVTAEVYKRDIAGTETLLGTSNAHPINGGTSKDNYAFNLGLSTILLTTTDRIVIKFSAGNLGGKTMTMYFEDSSPAFVITSFPGGVGPTGPTGPMAPAVEFDGGFTTTLYPYGPVLDCGGIF